MSESGTEGLMRVSQGVQGRPPSKGAAGSECGKEARGLHGTQVGSGTQRQAGASRDEGVEQSRGQMTTGLTSHELLCPESTDSCKRVFPRHGSDVATITL